MIWLWLLACGHDPVDTGLAGGSDTQAHQDDTGTRIDGCSGERAPLQAETCVEQAPCQWSGDQLYAYFGWSVASGGDLDGDGRDDLAIGAPAGDTPTDDGGVRADAGRVFIISGAGLDQQGSGARAVIEGDEDAGNLGQSLAVVGDMDGDGLAELLMGAPGTNAGAVDAGSVYVRYGSVSGWQEDRQSVQWTPRLLGESTGAHAGAEVASAGDVDGDGLTDLLLSGELAEEVDGDEVQRDGRIYLLRGRRLSGDTSLADADVRLDGDADGGGAGLALAAGDIDGDGYSDLVVGAPYGAGRAGRVYLRSGGALEDAGMLSDAGAQLTGVDGDLFGWDVAAGDLDGDGRAEVVIGSPLADDSYGSAGRVTIYQGLSAPTVLATIDGDWDDQQLATGIIAGHDLDGDGLGDLLLGSVNSYRGLLTKAGRVVLIPGRSGGAWPTRANEAPTAVFGAGVKDYLGGAQAVGDLDGDGADDLILGTGLVNTELGTDIGRVYLFWGGET